MERAFVDNGAGWELAIRRASPPAGRAAGRPALIVPGYGMNSFIFGFHPKGLSLEEYLASRGIETYSVDLRDQGMSRRIATTSPRARGAPDRYGLAELAVEDVAAAVRHVLATTETGAREVDLVGCSLGAALMFGYVAATPGPPVPVGRLVSVGGLVRWVQIHPALRALFAFPSLVERVRVKNTRKLAEVALPALARWAPGLLAPYLHVSSTDVSRAAEMVQTVEDPNPFVNRDIAEWIARRDLVVRGVNVSEAVRSMKHPFMCVLANHDGIVPPATARWPYDAIGSPEKELLSVGDDTLKMAHADLFLSTGVQEKVFARLATFLAKPLG